MLSNLEGGVWNKSTYVCVEISLVLVCGIYVAAEEAVLLLLQKSPCLCNICVSTSQGKKTTVFFVRVLTKVSKDYAIRLSATEQGIGL